MAQRFVDKAAMNGTDVFAFLGALNAIRNLRTSVDA
jgi:pyruvate/oxaloacetate carboxyltransferase